MAAAGEYHELKKKYEIYLFIYHGINNINVDIFVIYLANMRVYLSMGIYLPMFDFYSIQTRTNYLFFSFPFLIMPPTNCHNCRLNYQYPCTNRINNAVFSTEGVTERKKTHRYAVVSGKLGIINHC